MQTPVLIGIDGGGTYTRILCTDLDGHVLARTQSGGANPSKNVDAEENVQSAITEVLKLAGVTASQIIGVVAGIAGFDEPADLEWAERFTTIPGMSVKPTCVNDAVIAWAGALTLQPGIVIIAGTGCIIFGVTESGRHLRNYDFHHYANATARDLTFATVYRILAGEYTPADSPLIDAISQHFGIDSLAALAQFAGENGQRDRRLTMRLYGEAAPLITQAALQRVPLARAVCDQATEELVRGLRLLGSLFTNEPVNYALIGGVAQSEAMRNRIIAMAAAPTNHKYRICDTRLPPEAGAILLAQQHVKKTLEPSVIDNLLITAPNYEAKTFFTSAKRAMDDTAFF